MIGVLGASSAMLMAYGASATGTVNVSGAVNKPGAFYISSPQTLHSAIKEMGGLALQADKRRIQITSADGTVRHANLNELGTIPMVHPGDQVEVEAIDPTKSVVVQGGVSRQGALDFKPGMTIVDALKEAEPSKLASLQSVKVLRRAEDGTIQVHKADLLAMHAGKTAPMELRAGDTVAVPVGNSMQMSDRDILTIVVIGLLILVIVD